MTFASRGGLAALALFTGALAPSRAFAASFEAAEAKVAVASADGTPPDLVLGVADLRELLEGGLARLERLAGIAVVDRSLEKKTAPGEPDWQAQLFTALGAKGPLPLTVSAGITEDGPWAHLAVRAEEGALARIEALKLYPGLGIDPASGAVTLEGEPQPVSTRYAEGWLHVWFGTPEDFPSRFGLPNNPYRDTLLEGGQAFLLYDGTGSVGEQLRAEARDEFEVIFSEITSATFVFGRSGDRSSWVRTAIEHPQLAMLSPMLAAGTTPQDDLPLWGDEVTAMFDLSLPALMLKPALAAIPDLPAAWATVIPQLDGRLGLAVFGDARDWALNIGFLSPEAASEALPALREGLLELSVEVAPGLNTLISSPTAEGVDIHLHAEHAPLKLTAEGRRVVLRAQRARVLSPEAPQLILEPVRALLDDASLMSGYLRGGSDSLLFDLYLLTLAGVAEAAPLWAELPPEWVAPLREQVRALQDATLLARAQSLFLYDFAFSLSVGGKVLRLDLVTSDL